MSKTSVPSIERFKRLSAIKELSEEGKTDYEISKEMNLPIMTIKRNMKYLEELATADISTKEIAQKRSELYLEVVEATEEARALFMDYKATPNMSSIEIRRMFSAWLEAIQLRAKLYGLMDVKVDNVINLNQQFNDFNAPKDTVDVQTGQKLAKIIKESHEQKVKDKFDENVHEVQLD